MRKFVHDYKEWIWSVVIMTMGLITVYLIVKKQENNYYKERQSRLHYTHERALNQLSTSVENFATLVSGMQAYANLSRDFPTAQEMQRFVIGQLDQTHAGDSIIVSFIDSTHNFVYSFSREIMDPFNLTGRSVREFRDDAEIARLELVMKTDSVKLMYPLNLVEGWVGIPIDFRVHRNGQTLGYMAALINFKSIIQNIYDDEVTKEFVFHFSTDHGFDFDRESYHDGSKIYNNQVDKEYYKNFRVNSNDFVYSKIEFYGREFKIGTSYKNEIESYASSNLLYLFYLVVVLFLILMTWQITRFRIMASIIRRKNKLLTFHQQEISTKNDKLNQLNETKDRFFAIIGHDVRGPLNAIQGLLNVLKSEKLEDTSLNRLFYSLEQSVQNTVNLLNNLLKWATSQTGEIEFIPTQFSLNGLIKEIIDTLSEQASLKYITIKNESKSELSLFADGNMIETVIRNLVSNAIKFSNNGGEIVISAVCENDNAIISIHDNGVGMSEKQVNRLFEINRQLSTRGTSGEMGSGLGLILAKEFIAKHHGKIEVESELNMGTVFRLILPLNFQKVSV
ncbi:MAG: HAMP domain-containing sensor histidine kinase [Reichenbachiella sp.]|uniref:HAMP domain-containing sensor histidine kinase n=1 Tax=Reichenbachiella sp. TaxID=2184521 RepID=UPI003298D426